MACSLPGSSVHGIFQGKNTGVGCHFLLQSIFLTQGSNPHLLHILLDRRILYQWATWEAQGGAWEVVGGGNSTHLTGSMWGLKVRICRTLRLEKHWVCPFLDKASTNSKGNKWIPLFLSPWLPSPALSEHLPPKTCISIVSSSSTSCCFLHKPSLSTRRRFTGFYEQEQNRDERPSFLTLRSFIHMSTDLSLNHSTVIAE